MTSLFDRIRILLGAKPSREDKTEPVVSQPAESQANESTDNRVYYSILRGEPVVLQTQPEELLIEIPGAKTAINNVPEPQKQTEEVSMQVLELNNHARELEQMRHYAELAKQNRLDRDALNEDLE